MYNLFRGKIFIYTLQSNLLINLNFSFWLFVYQFICLSLALSFLLALAFLPSFSSFLYLFFLSISSFLYLSPFLLSLPLSIYQCICTSLSLFSTLNSILQSIFFCQFFIFARTFCVPELAKKFQTNSNVDNTHFLVTKSKLFVKK